MLNGYVNIILGFPIILLIPTYEMEVTDRKRGFIGEWAVRACMENDTEN